MSGKNNLKSINLYWSIISISLLFFGGIFSASLQGTAFRNLGFYFLAIGGGSLVAYFIYAFLYIVLTGDHSDRKTLVVTYIGACLLAIVGGLVGAMLYQPWGMQLFLSGIGAFIIFWVIVLFYYIFMYQDETEQK
ncbi:hypothetical protein [Ornithobacterium rhinotracheale]|uniref:Uncharacterized protein n=1 Tax=Ornithobacterium rhinotracheale (strain ATCC 51463 / DSM 15997 / CCUG 23171 / CIP 104009 / LMG 9086) TaxID=867902 RepID=I3ZZ65_ORNRL|nr:hypothetical protein [Ornithobacterium rhinotracheale]AFL96999.1 hypothetical protein Ornrh_0803 [Ornithobacterium rhinotracheale DSM 15997]